MKHDLVLILDFGGQYTQLIARRVRECSVYCQIKPFDIDINEIISLKPKAIILSGGPSDVNNDFGYQLNKDFWNKINVPVLGICYGMQLMVKNNGGVVSNNHSTEFGKVDIILNNKSELFYDINPNQKCWMSHNDSVANTNNKFAVIASTNNCKFAAVKHIDKKWYGVQFHPEVTHTPFGKQMLNNFLFLIANVNPTWEAKSIIDEQVALIRETIKDKKAICALSGGVDSLVAATLVSKAIGNNLLCVFVDHGLLRKNEKAEVFRMVNKIGLNVKFVNAEQLFLNQLKGVKEPEQKRKIIGNLFIKVFEKIKSELDDSYQFLVQGTIYPDIVESGNKTNKTIKSHHNVGGLPKDMKFKLVEPLKELFKDEVRSVGLLLNLPKENVYRQPFPGPGLGVRVIGEVSKDKLDVLREADYIFRNKLMQTCSKLPWQYFAVILDSKSVGVVGDNRAYGYTICLRAVDTEDAMSCEWSKIDLNLLAEISSLITNKIPKVNRVVYDITNKPPGTIEWE